MLKIAHLLVILLIVMPMTTIALEMSDYIQPDSTFDEAYFTGRFNLNNGNQEQTSFNGTMLGYYDLTYSTLPFTWNVRMDGVTDFKRGSNATDSTQKSYDLTASTNINKYFGSTRGIFAYSAVDVGYRKLLADDNDDPDNNVANEPYYAKIGAGMGYGRIFDATPLAYVLRFIEELKNYGVIIGKIDDRAYLEMAQIIAREDEFKSTYGFQDYKQYWIADIEKVLVKYGCLKNQGTGCLKNNTLGALGILKMHDVLFEERVNIRKHGWTFTTGIGFVAYDYSGHENDPALDFEYKYTLPIGYHFQFIETLQYSILLKEDIIKKIHNRMSVTYELSDRIDWENVWDVKITLPTEAGAQDLTAHEINSIFRYYLSNRLSTDFTLSLSHVEDDIENNGNDDVETAIFIGLTYRLK